MGQRAGWGARAAALGQRTHARLAGLSRARGPIAWPEPRLAGSPAQGRRLLAGRFRIGGEVVTAPGRSIWDVAGEGPEAGPLHACRWLDDLAALGDAKGRALAQVWVADWIARYGRGAGPGWTPERTAERLLRWIGHGRLLLRPPNGVEEARLARAVAAQAAFLARRWRKAAPGRARMAALAALIQAGLALPDRRRIAERAAGALAREAAQAIDGHGAIATRNPEELLEILGFLTDSIRALTEAGIPADPALGGAVARGAPVLRALRHGDGGLARFHGGCRGEEGRVDQVLAAAGRPVLSGLRPGTVGARVSLPLHMGFARLAAGRTTVIIDAAPPPTGPASTRAHASTLAFELTSGRRPLVVSCGAGLGFGAEWHRAGRATPCHSTLWIEGFSSARLGPVVDGEESPRLVDAPSRVIAEAAPASEGVRVELAHDGWRETHGLTHARLLHLAPDGGRLSGEDMLTTLTAADIARFDRALDAADHLGLAYFVRFHLHPDVEADLAPDGTAALMTLRSGEEWTLSFDGEATLSLEPSVYMEEGRLEPRPALQVMLAGRALQRLTRLRWTLGRTQGTSRGLRDLTPDDPWDEEDE